MVDVPDFVGPVVAPCARDERPRRGAEAWLASLRQRLAACLQPTRSPGPTPKLPFDFLLGPLNYSHCPTDRVPCPACSDDHDAVVRRVFHVNQAQERCG